MGADGAKKATSLQVISQVIKTEGASALYTGLSAGLLRQASYTTVRMGVYTSIIDYMSVGCKTSFVVQFASGLTASAAGAFVGTPA